MYKIRFNLSRGVRYMTWKITYPNKSVEYLQPSEVVLVMKNCRLHNNKNAALKIFNGGNKTVCAYIVCTELDILECSSTEVSGNLISYNPRVQPNWVDHLGNNIDNKKINKITSNNSSLFT